MDKKDLKYQIDTMMDHFQIACKKAGLKITHQRTEIYRQLLLTPDHPSAEVLHRRLLSLLPMISLDTVYRTLTTFEEYGLVCRIMTAESQARFEATHLPHHHLICTQCKKVHDFTWPALDTTTLPTPAQDWGSIHSTTIVMSGICNDCLPSVK